MTTGTPTHLELVAEYVDRLAVADRQGAVARTQELLAEGRSRAELLEVIGEAQREVGRLWQVNAWTVAQEHAATAVSESVLQALSIARLPVEDRGHVAVVCADGEWHVLPARILAERLTEAEYRVTFVGGSVPPEHLHDYLPSMGVDAVAISCTLSQNLPGAARTIAAVHAVGLPALVGGIGFGEDGRRAAAIGADAWAPDPTDALAVLESWRDRDVARAARPTLNTGEHADVLRDLGRLTDEAYDALEGRIPGREQRSVWETDRNREDLQYHLRHLAAALLVGDDTVYLDLMPWMADMLLARGIGLTTVHVTLEVLAEVLDDHGLSEAVALVGRARTLVPTA